MTANELRIGNLVDVCGSIVNVDPVDILVFTQDKLIWGPIPLTEEWLVKFGFIDCNYTMDFGELTFSWASRVISTGVRNGWSCDQYPHIRYVHQVQNLYFALTGTELEIK